MIKLMICMMLLSKKMWKLSSSIIELSLIDLTPNKPAKCLEISKNIID